MSKVHRFNFEYQARQMVKNRMALPASRRIRLETAHGLSKIVMEADFGAPHGWLEVGHISYAIGPLDDMYKSAALLRNAPGIETGAVFQIVGFYSTYETQVKGIGSALLHEVVRLAELRGCVFVVVLSGINAPVYEAFDFKHVDPGVDTWCISTKALKTRTLGAATTLTGATLV